MRIIDKIKKGLAIIEWREMITKILYMVIFSMLLFYTIDINKKVYIIVSFGIWFILLINYKRRENIIFYLNTISLCFCNLMTFILMKYLKGHQIRIDIINVVYLVYAIMLLTIYIYCWWLQVNVEIEATKEKKLFSQRNHDLERVIYYLNDLETIGINGSWGSGKSFLINELKKLQDIQEKYIFIKIDLLSCNLDDIQTILLNEMEKVLYTNQIFSRHSKKLKKILGKQTLLQNIGELFVRNEVSFSGSLAGFRHEIEYLDKTIVVVYEDIDRINNSEIIKKIFSISENISSHKIKIIYQYDEENLKRIDASLNRNYIEKYIPYTINLTEIKFFDILEHFFKELNINKNLLILEDFSYLQLPIYVDSYLIKKLQVVHELKLVIRGITIRKVELFLKELITSLKQKEIYRMKENKRDVITFYFIKHFWYSIYERFNLEDGLLETFYFEYKEKKYTILQLISLYNDGNNRMIEQETCNRSTEEREQQVLTSQDIKNIFKKAQNIEILAFLSIFAYKYDVYEPKRNEEEILSETVLNIMNKNINEKKNRLIWNLICNGKSEYTNQEFAINKLNEMVLSESREKQQGLFKQFLEEFFNRKFENKDNTTIFRIGVSKWHALFQAFCVANVSKDKWLMFLEFYFNFGEVKDIDVCLIENLKYCNVNLREVYLDILKRFNKLNIIGNLNGQKCYKSFLKNYLEALSSLQYINTEELWGLEDDSDGISNVEFVQNHILNPIKEKMEKQKTFIPIPSIQEDIDVIITFIQKNYDVIGKSNSLQYPTLHVNTNIQSTYVHKEEFDRLSSLELSEENYLKEVERSYKNGEIGAYEIMRLPKFNKKG